MLKPLYLYVGEMIVSQPPSGGCVLKPRWSADPTHHEAPAAFGRLCVETMHLLTVREDMAPAAFGRLCVETMRLSRRWQNLPPAAFGRLCVETAKETYYAESLYPAAFGRLCVETVAA